MNVTEKDHQGGIYKEMDDAKRELEGMITCVINGWAHQHSADFVTKWRDASGQYPRMWFHDRLSRIFNEDWEFHQFTEEELAEMERDKHGAKGAP